MSTAVAQEQNNGALVPLQAIERMAQYMVKSGLFGVKTQEQAVALMLIAQAEGMHPAIAARDYHIIQGRHSLKADAMLARFQQAGGTVEWQDFTDEKVSAYFSHPQSPRKVFIEWDMERAKRADLGNKDNWKKWPRQMLRARVISEGVRSTYPGVAVGVYTPEEVQDFDDAPHGQTAKKVESLNDKLKEARKEDIIEGEVVTDADKTIDAAQWRDIQAQCKAKNKDPKDLLAKFNASKGSDLKESQLSLIYDWIDNAA